MNNQMRTLAFAASLFCGAVAMAAPPVKIDTEQKAAAAFVSAVLLGHESPSYNYAALERAVFLSNRALQKAASVATPASLMASASGIVVPCETSGTMTARMAPKLPRVFKFEWHDCHFPLDGAPNTLDGAGEVVLLSDTFTPTKVASIRFGNASSDLVATRLLSFPWAISSNTMARNLRIAGNIPMTISQFVTDTSSPFNFIIAGFTNETATYEDLSSGRPPSTTVFRTEFDSVAYSGTYAYDLAAMRYTEDVLARFGTVTFKRTDPPPYGVNTQKYRYEGFRVRTVSNFTTSERSRSLDGRLEYSPNPFFGAGCLSGIYSFRTNAPLHTAPSPFQPFDAGDLTINGTARVTLFSAANIPPTLPAPVKQTLVHIDVARVGAFNYDVDDLFNDLRPVSGCM